MDIHNRQSFFKLRLKEILRDNTLDSYRVRTHNAHTLVVELRDVISNWLKGNIKQFETVKLCVLETKKKLSTDKIFLEGNNVKKFLCSNLEKLEKSEGKNKLLCQRTLTLLEQIISVLDNNVFINTLLERIYGIISLKEEPGETVELLDKALEELDNIISNLCTELLYVGFSKHYLYGKAMVFFKSELSFQDAFDSFKDAVNPDNKREYVVIFRLTLGKAINDIHAEELLKTFPPEYLIEWVKTKTPNFISLQTNQRLFVANVGALDKISAVKEGKEQLNKFLDKTHYALNHSNIIPGNSVLVLEKMQTGYFASVVASLPIMDGVNTHTDLIEIEKIKDGIQKIQSSEKFNGEIRNRLVSAFRHLRIGDNDTEIEQRFINYWIALEFLFSTPYASDSTFGRIKENLVNILMAQYGRRNLMSFDSQTKEHQVKEKEELHVWELEKEEDIKLLFQDSVLLSYRYRCFKNHLLSGEKNKIKGYLELHKLNLQWQIARIYRLRNELVHEAAIKQNIENLTSNLRYYLIAVLDQALSFYETENFTPEMAKYGLEPFFVYYDLIYSKIDQELSLEAILKKPAFRT